MPVAQLDRASACGAEGHTFESCRAYQIKKKVQRTLFFIWSIRHDLVYNYFMDWEKITDIILYSSIAVLGVFVILGLYQWISRKSIKKVDRKILAMIPPLILMAITYVVFDKFIVLATRPNGSGESSFPSTHVMVVATIFFMTIIALPKYLKSKSLCTFLDLVMSALICLVAYGRVEANMHWPTDVIFGVVFAAVFATIYYLLSKKRKKKETNE